MKKLYMVEQFWDAGTIIPVRSVVEAKNEAAAEILAPAAIVEAVKVLTGGTVVGKPHGKAIVVGEM